MQDDKIVDVISLLLGIFAVIRKRYVRVRVLYSVYATVDRKL